MVTHKSRPCYKKWWAQHTEEEKEKVEEKKDAENWVESNFC